MQCKANCWTCVHDRPIEEVCTSGSPEAEAWFWPRPVPATLSGVKGMSVPPPTPPRNGPDVLHMSIRLLLNPVRSLFKEKVT